MPAATLADRIAASATELGDLFGPSDSTGTPAQASRFDNRRTWDNATKRFDNRRTWDNWDKKNWKDKVWNKRTK